MSSLKTKIAKFVEAEIIAPVDTDLLETLRGLSVLDTFYWTLPPAKRNAFNEFFRELHDELDGQIIEGKYGASTIIDSIIVTAFETGYRLRDTETEIEDKGKGER